MAPELSDHEARLRLLELALAELKWQAVATKANLERVTPLVDALAQWHRDSERDSARRSVSLTRGEKLIGVLLVALAPALTILIQHALR